MNHHLLQRSLKSCLLFVIKAPTDSRKTHLGLKGKWLWRNRRCWVPLWLNTQKADQISVQDQDEQVMPVEKGVWWHRGTLARLPQCYQLQVGTQQRRQLHIFTSAEAPNIARLQSPRWVTSSKTPTSRILSSQNQLPSGTILWSDSTSGVSF